MCGFSKKKKKPAYGIEPVLVPSGTKLPSFVHLPIVGEIAVGKTSLLHRFVGQQFPTGTTPTIVDFFVREFHMLNGEVVQLRLVDTGGQERFYALSKTFLQRADGVIAVYDESRPETLVKLIEYWLPLVRQAAGNARFMLVVGNKRDKSTKSTDQQIDNCLELLHQACQTFKVTHIRISAKLTPNAECEAVFEAFARRVIRNLKDGEPSEVDGFQMVSLKD